MSVLTNARLRRWARRVQGLRIPSTPLHRLLAAEYWMRRVALGELARITYYQPMFESACRQVGEGFHLRLCPDSKVPIVGNVDVEIGRRVSLSARCTISGAPNSPRRPRLLIGDDTFIADRCSFRVGTQITIGSHVLIAGNALLAGDPGHPLDAIARRTKAAPADTLGRIDIGDDVWIAYNVSIIGNVRVGKGAVIAANSVVVRDVPEYALVAGNPARVLRTLQPDEQPPQELFEATPHLELTVRREGNVLRPPV